MKSIKIALILSALLCSALFCSCNKDQVEIGPIAESNEGEMTMMEPVVSQTADQLVTDEISSVATEEEVSESPFTAAVNKITESVEWAVLDRITDNEIAKEFFKLDLENPDYKDILIMQCPMSGQVAEIIIIETENVDAAKADLETRKDKLINEDAFYPNSKIIAENSIVGTYNNIAYFIAGANAEPSEEILLESLKESGY